MKRSAVGILICLCVASAGLPTTTSRKGIGQEGLRAGGPPVSPNQWPVYGGESSGDHYSPLSQINRNNVHRLAVAWTFDTGDSGWLEANPLVVDDVLYGVSAKEKVFALDASNGHLLWKFDSGVDGTQPVRGLSFWTDGKDSRLFVGVMNFLYALDPKSGHPITSFGEDGRIDLRKGLRRDDYLNQSIALTSPGVVYRDLIIVGGRNPEAPPAPPGDIRAFDVRTGALRWRFKTIPEPGEPGCETWPKDAWKTAGAANNWAGMSLDEPRGILYVPTGSAVPDFYGGERVGDDLFADSLIALDAGTGKLIWNFQGVHHDLWDRDFPSPPALVTIVKDGQKVDAIAQTTKQGWLFLFDRATGKPLFPIKEIPVPGSDVPGEVAAPTQPMPELPAPYTRQLVTEDSLTNRTPEAHAWALNEFKNLHNGVQFTPFSAEKQTIIVPGYDGGAEWGGPALDPATGVIYINANDIADKGGLSLNDDRAGIGALTYQNQCAVCHGETRAGSPPAFPSLIGVEERLTPEQISEKIHKGGGRMPSFPSIGGETLDALIRYLSTGKDPGKATTSSAPQTDEYAYVKYRFTGYGKFFDPEGYPAIAPPWGTLSAIDLNSGRYLWHIPLGEYPELSARGIPPTGTENYGGPIVTAGGLVFIGATIFDRKFHAFDSHAGKLLWEAELPYAGLATPSTYMVKGRQYVVIAAGGGRDPKAPNGGAYVAFALH